MVVAGERGIGEQRRKARQQPVAPADRSKAVFQLRERNIAQLVVQQPDRQRDGGQANYRPDFLAQRPSPLRDCLSHFVSGWEPIK